MEAVKHRRKWIHCFLVLAIAFSFINKAASKNSPPFHFGLSQNARLTASNFARGSVKPRSSNPCVGSHLPCLHSKRITPKGRSLNADSENRVSFKPSQPVFFMKTMKEALSPQSPLIPSQYLELPRIDKIEKNEELTASSKGQDLLERCTNDKSSNCQTTSKSNNKAIADNKIKSKMFILTIKPTLTAILVQSKNGRFLQRLTRRTLLNQMHLPSRFKHTNNKCSHPFHSWTCQKINNPNPSKKNRGRILENKSLSSIGDRSKVQAGSSLEKEAATKDLVKQDYDPCSIPFHALGCRKNSISSKPFLKLQDVIERSQEAASKTQLKENENGSARSSRKYDKCSHPFHSWLCRNNASTNNSIPTPRVITQEPIDIPVSLQPQSSIGKSFDDSRSKSTAYKDQTKKYDKCSHPFHAWLCQKARSNSKPKTITKPVTRGPIFLPSTTSPATVKTKPVETQIEPATKPLGKTLEQNHQTYDKCSHAFHSWLCERGRKAQRIESPTTKIAIENVVVTERSPTTVHSFPVINYSRNLGKSFDRSTKLPVISTTKSPNIIYNKCQHAFHSWLCNAVHKKAKKIETFSLTTPIPTTTEVNLAKALISHKPKHVQSSVRKYDKCSHPFHSWLCQRTQKQKTKPNRHRITSTPKQIDWTLNKKDAPRNQDCSTHPHSEKCRKSKLDYSHKKSQPSHQSSFKSSPPSSNNKESGLDYNKCNHAFHKWLCPVKRLPSHIKIDKSVSINNQTGKSLIQTTPMLQTSSYKPSSLPSSTPVSTHYSDTNPCNHAFHSWLCRGNSQRIQKINQKTTDKPANRGKSIITSSLKTIPPAKVTKATPEKTRMRTSSWKGANPCTHAFHAWLCQPLRPRLVGAHFSPPRPTMPRNAAPSLTKVQFIAPALESKSSATSLDKSENAPKSFDSGIAAVSKRKEFSLLPRAYLVDNRNPRNSSHTEMDLKGHCNHHFHPWMCSTFANRHPDFPLSEIPDIRSLPLEDENIVPLPFQESPRKVRRVGVTDSFQRANQGTNLNQRRNGNGKDSRINDRERTIPKFLDEEVPISKKSFSRNSDFSLERFSTRMESKLLQEYSFLEPLNFESLRIVPIKRSR